MLYITTRSNKDAFTAYKALHSCVAPDGGRFVPFCLPTYDEKDILALKTKSFSEVVAEILNKFFSCNLTGWDVDFCIGRNNIRLADTGNKVVVAELWHNLGSSFTYLTQKLYSEISENDGEPTDWFKIAVQIAVLFGAYAELLRFGHTNLSQTIDVSLPAGDFSFPIAAWYARKMGLPIETIICTCNDNGIVWDLIHRGSYNGANTTNALNCTIPRLIQGTLGFDAVKTFLTKCAEKQVFTVDEEELPKFNAGYFCSVAGENRSGSIINSVYRNSAYILDPDTAQCYGGLQDYRAKSGCNRLTVLLSKESALSHAAEVINATGIAEEKLTELLNHS